jgi:midasin
VNQEEIEENHGIAPKGAEENGDDENGADDDLELPDDMQLDGQDEGGAGEDAEGDDKNSDGEKMDDDVDDGAGENGDAGDDDRNETNAEDENGGGELDQVMEKVDGGDDDEKAEEDENAGGAAEDDTGNIGEDDEGVQGGPSGAGTGGGVGEDDDDAAKQDNGDQGGDVGAGAEGEGEETTLADARAKPAPGFDDAGDFENGDTDNNGVDQNQSALEAPGGGGEGGGGGASASAAGEGAAAPLADGEAPPPAGASLPPPPPRKKPEGNDANPHRSLGDALKGWREKLSVIGDAVERPDSSVGEKRDADENDAVELPAREYEFERDAKESGGAAGDEDEAHGEGKGGGVQALAGATKEQAAAAAANGLDRSQNPAGEGVENENAEPIAPVADDSDAHSDDKNQKELPQELPENRNEMDVDTATATDDVDDDSPDDIQDPNKGKSLEERGAAKARRKGKATDDKKPKNLKESLGAGVGITEDVPGDEGADGEIDENDAFGGRGELGEETVVTLKALEDVSLDDAEREDVSPEELSPEEIASARAEAVAALGEWRERTASGAGGSDHLAHALWNRLELLTGALSGELAEQVRIVFPKSQHCLLPFCNYLLFTGNVTSTGNSYKYITRRLFAYTVHP